MESQIKMLVLANLTLSSHLANGRQLPLSKDKIMENKLVKSQLFGFFASLLKQIELRKLLNFKETMNHYKSLKLV